MNLQDYPRMNAFLTGSRAYGAPRPNSDTDLVVRVTPELEKLLASLGDPSPDGSIRFGNLNLVTCDNDKKFQIWMNGTEHLIERRLQSGPVSREDAKAHFLKIGAQGYRMKGDTK